jgi:nucleotide-binding universal stress UspA family protein
MPGDIVVGIGGDGIGTAAARTAARLADAMGSTLVVVFGFEASALGPRGGALEDEIAAVGAAATTHVRESLAVAHPGLRIEVELVRDRPVEALLRVAEARDAEMIVVGHGGRGPLRAAILGSVPYELVHRNVMAVLVVPDEEEDEDDGGARNPTDSPD